MVICRNIGLTIVANVAFATGPVIFRALRSSVINYIYYIGFLQYKKSTFCQICHKQLSGGFQSNAVLPTNTASLYPEIPV